MDWKVGSGTASAALPKYCRQALWLKVPTRPTNAARCRALPARRLRSITCTRSRWAKSSCLPTTGAMT